jgi:hypothetical protein
MGFLLASQMTALTRQVGRIRLSTVTASLTARSVSFASPQPAAAALLIQGSSCSTNYLTTPTPALTSTSMNMTTRSFATKVKKAAGAEKKRVAAVASAKKGDGNAEDKEGALQNQEWVKFQKSIAVDGFETGQTMQVLTSNKKVRGGASRRKTGKSEVEERLAERARLSGSGGGSYPPLRYSDEETERLLAEAYAAIPKRDGKRGTRNLKRQATRWHLVRKIHKKVKYHMANHQTRKMEKRSLKIKQVKGVLEESPGMRDRDRAYQAQVFERWAANMVPDPGEEIFLDSDAKETI